jgi:hypothetical protein
LVSVEVHDTVSHRRRTIELNDSGAYSAELSPDGRTLAVGGGSGCIWFGESIQDVIAHRDADGSEAPLFFIRVGSATYYRKGGHR